MNNYIKEFSILTDEEKQALAEVIYYIEADCNDISEIVPLKTHSLELLVNALEKYHKRLTELENNVHYKMCKECGNEFVSKRCDAIYCDKCAKQVCNKNWYKNLTEDEKSIRRERAKESMRKLRAKRKDNI